MSGTSGVSLDRMRLVGLRAHGHHGVLASERRDGQEFVVDVELGLDTRQAASTDDLSDSVDYGVLADDLNAAVSTRPADLIETLAQRLAEICLRPPAVAWVEVTVHKPQAPLAQAFDDVTLTIHRSRND
jgi:dihydroneopterin aldolase